MMQGNIAVAEGALAAGCRAEHLARQLPAVGGRFMQMEDEIAAMGAVIGASLGGA